MAVLLGLAAAVVYGAADFMGGMASKRTGVLSVVLVSQLFGSALLALVLPFLLTEAFGSEPVLWGVAAGVSGGFGVLFLYRGLARGKMSVVAPITAVGASSIPVVFGLLSGESPGALAASGMALAIVAVILVSLSPDAGDEPTPARRSAAAKGLLDAVAAGFFFAFFFIFLDVAGSAAGLWPLVGARVGSFALIGLAALAAHQPLAPARGSMLTIAAVGVLDVAANVLYVLAIRTGLLSLVAVLTSLYPASTVILARTVLGERMSRPQLAGVALAAAGVALMAAG